MRKNRDYVTQNGRRLRDRFKGKKSNIEYTLGDSGSQSGPARMQGDGNRSFDDENREGVLYYPEIRSSKAGFNPDDEETNVEVERAPRTDLSKAEKIESVFVPKSGKKLKTNRYMLFTSMCILLLFAGMIAYLVHFTIYEAPGIITSPYNKRTAALSQNIIRGSIKSANGKVLAETEIDDEGKEHRSYHYDEIFAHAVGYASHGKGGIESAFNYELLTSHEPLLEQFKRGITGKKNIGDTVCSTLDTRLQERAYDVLEGMQGTIIAIEPKTGKVRAMVSKPDFNPNTLDEDWEDINSEDGSSLLNRAVYGIYPPGSTYKTLTALAYIEENPGSFKDFKYKCKGETVVNSVRIRCYKGAEHGKEDLGYAFAHSCNTAFVTIGSKLDLKKFVRLNEDFLFNSEIKFDMPVKRSRAGLTEKSKKSEIPQAVIGQGNTLITPFHNALIMCGIANGGVLMEPTLLDHIESADGTVVSRNKSREWKRVADESDAAIMTKYLRQVVTEGTGRALDSEDYSVAGKTGTAENGTGEDHSWFVGFSNVKDPDLVVCVLVEHGGAGSEVAAPIADEIFDCYYSNELYKDYRKSDKKD